MFTVDADDWTFLVFAVFFWHTRGHRGGKNQVRGGGLLGHSSHEYLFFSFDVTPILGPNFIDPEYIWIPFRV